MARIPKLDSAGKFLAADVNAQIDARTKATMRADLPALAKELKIGGVDGSVPIFATLAEAKAWEAVNPGKKALTLDGTPPSTEPQPPVVVQPGTLLVSDDFEGATGFMADGTGSRRSTPVGGLAWQTADKSHIDDTAHTTLRFPAMSGGKFVAGLGSVKLPTQKVSVTLDYSAKAGTPGTSTGIALGGRYFVAATSNSSFRVLTYNATNSTWPATVGALSIPYKDSGSMKVTYDGVTITWFLDGVQVYQAPYTLQHDYLAIRTNGATVSSDGKDIAPGGDRWIDNLKVTFHG